ncbi:MAG TPA: glycogen debranching protein GlgX [Cellvibrionaceae bacterium]
MKTDTKFLIERGQPFPLGSTVQAGGVNFALFSQHADEVELCIFSPDGQTEIAHLSLPQCTNQIWHGFVPGLEAGAVYGYRVYGPYDPHRGLRFNPNKLLLDPYARALVGDFVWHDSHYGFTVSEPAQDLTYDDRDNAHWMIKGQVVAAGTPPQPLKTPVAWEDTVIFEAHVKGLTYRHPDIPEEERGTYKALAHPAMLAHYRALGITSLELLPVHSFVHDHFLIKRNLTNYWGYNTLSFFAPQRAYACSSDAIAEFKQMVHTLHGEGIEVILDVVFNHTAEGSQLGPTLSFRGIDNSNYYTLLQQDARFYINDTGCGNTFNVRHPKVLQLVMDSLRYWACEMGVDGFRFDLATVLAREAGGFDAGCGFLDALAQDPLLAGKKMIAEPWDIGPGGYQLGNFPPGWSEWNDRYRDVLRRFWRGDRGVLPELARRLHGSAELFEYTGRSPQATINFITSHDGFTMADLVAYNQRHNLANKEFNNDGHHANFSYNHGEEGPSNNPHIQALRQRQQRNMLASLIFSQGVPMILAGDELGHSQGGNNNAYCQDNSATWLNWAEADTQLTTYVARALAIRRAHPLLRKPFYIHKPDELGAAKGFDIHWLDRQARPMRSSDWQEQNLHSLQWMIETEDAEACKKAVLVLLNADERTHTFYLPLGWRWECLLDSRHPQGEPIIAYLPKGSAFMVHDKSLLLFYGESLECSI